MKNTRFFKHLKLLNLGAALAIILALAAPADLLAAPQKADAQASVRKNSSKSGTKASSKSGSKSKGKAASAQKSGKSAPKAAAPWPQNLLQLAGDGAVLVFDPHATQGAQKELYALNAEKDYVPASILKIVTAAAALEFLGADYRFKTDFLLTRDKDLWIVGYGDPYIVSEEVTAIIEQLQKRGLKEVRDIYIDGSYFERDIILDGNTQTESRYDAYNTAFGVNFNTVSFRKNKKGQTVAAAPIPLTPLALKLGRQVKKQGLHTFSVNESPFRAELHSGEVFKAHLEAAKIPVTGEIFAGQTAPAQRKVFYRHLSTKTLEESLVALMKYSNNFMTNQIFLVLGAEMFGGPASLEKSQKAMNRYFQKYSLDPIVMGDGSGLSRTTTLTARQMAQVLEVVEANRHIFDTKDNGQVKCKTGTMSDIQTLAGFIERPEAPDKPLSFVILLNGKSYPGRTRDKILDILKDKFAANKSTRAPSAGQ